VTCFFGTSVVSSKSAASLDFKWEERKLAGENFRICDPRDKDRDKGGKSEFGAWIEERGGRRGTTHGEHDFKDNHHHNTCWKRESSNASVVTLYTSKCIQRTGDNMQIMAITN